MQRPVLPPEIHQYFIPVGSAPPGGEAIRYRPMVLGCAKVYYTDQKTGIDAEVRVSFLAPVIPGPVPVDWGPRGRGGDDRLGRAARRGGGDRICVSPDEAAKPRSYEAWKKSLADMLYRSHKLELMRSPTLKVASGYRESERQFRARLQQAAREARDEQVEKLRQKYAPKLAVLQDRLRRARQAVDVQREQASAAKMSSALSIGSAILSAFTGRKVASASNIGRAATAARGVGRSAKESSDIERAEENLRALEDQMTELDAAFPGGGGAGRGEVRRGRGGAGLRDAQAEEDEYCGAGGAAGVGAARGFGRG